MIAFLEGILESSGSNDIILNVNGVGYEVFVKNPHVYKVQQTYRFYTYAVYREDSQQLYGFKDIEQRNFFKLLVEKVKGVGPKLALELLSFFSMNDLCAIIFNQNVERLAECPGVGKKTAQRLILELQDYLKKVPTTVVHSTFSAACRDAIDALVVLGYGRKQAENLLDDIKMDIQADDSVETILRKIFKNKRAME